MRLVRANPCQECGSRPLVLIVGRRRLRYLALCRRINTCGLSFSSWLHKAVRLALLLCAVLLAACEDEATRAAREEKERSYALEQQCVRRHGSPVRGDDGLFRTCDFARDWHFSWHYKGPRRD